MYCKNCGREISDNAVVCPHCGVQVGTIKSTTGTVSEDKNSIAVAGFILSFFIALAGLICSIIGYKKAVNEGAPQKGLALAGIIISSLSMAFAAIFYAVIISSVLYI